MSKNLGKIPTGQKGSKKNSRKQQETSDAKGAALLSGIGRGTKAKPELRPNQGEIKYCRIHPGIGIARVGNSPDEFFIGPLAPDVYEPPPGGYKDAEGRVKRQAAQFRIYAYGEPCPDGKENVICELTSEDADIEWTVHLANKKADWFEFQGSYRDPSPEHADQRCIVKTIPRNVVISGMPGDPNRNILVIDPGKRVISGPNKDGVLFDTGTFGPLPLVAPPKPQDTTDCFTALIDNHRSPDDVPPIPPVDIPPNVTYSEKIVVPLGELRTDNSGRLLVLGGYGKSATVWDNPVGTYPAWNNADQFYFANNDFWHDDTSDGPVNAQVTLKGGPAVEVRGGAWVMVTPPKFAPDQINLTSLYDVAESIAQAKWPDKVPPSDKVYFWTDIYPILQRLDHLQWVNESAYRGHGTGTVRNFASPEMLKMLSDPASGQGQELRKYIFSYIRNPNLRSGSPEERAQANYAFMPQIFGDNGEPPSASFPEEGQPDTFQCLLVSQYAKLQKWAAGDFEPGSLSHSPAFAKIPVEDQPATLDKAALHPCVGGPFYPGIEITYIAAFYESWSEPFRLNAEVYGPGDITKHMALPWQADFYECNLNWWPAQRPDDIVTESEYKQALIRYDPKLDDDMLAQVLADRILWARGLPAPTSPTASPTGDNMMVQLWHEMGFVVPVEGPKDAYGNPQKVYIETERDPYAVMTERDYFYILMNIDSYPDFLPRAHKLVKQYLAQAWKNQDEADPDERWKFFKYTPESYDARLNEIYNNFVRDAENPQTYEEDLALTRDSVIYGLLQLAPFNQLDGTWLRHATPPGPIDDVHSMIFSIYMDEMGDGNVQQNHSNVYTDLLKSVNIYLPDMSTKAYAQNTALLDSAFTLPVFILAITQFSEEFFPELLGMTLQLEWEAVSLVPVVDQLNAFGIDPLYYVLHIGIDNAASGHGAIAKKAVEIFLDEVRENEGEEVMQEIWKRIWNGYVAFGTLGSLGQDIANYQSNPPSLNDRMINLIIQKQPYGSMNHRSKMLGPNQINDWFADPQGFLNELQKSGIVIPGRPDISPIFRLMSFNGPMYHVFTEDEQALWSEWVLSLAQTGSEPAFNLVKAMHVLINYLRERQQGNDGHKVLLKGPNPFGSTHEYPDAIVTQPIKWWFDLNQYLNSEAAATALMRALSFEENGWIKKYDAAQSPLITDILSGTGDMAVAFQDIEPNTGGKTYKEVIVMWIDYGCPIEETLAKPHAMTGGTAAAPALESAGSLPAKGKTRRRIWGNGKVH